MTPCGLKGGGTPLALRQTKALADRITENIIHY